MNLARHMAWMMNPNLSSDDIMRLVEKDATLELERLRQAGDEAIRIGREMADFHRKLGDPHWKRKGQQAALDYMSRALPMILCS